MSKLRRTAITQLYVNLIIHVGTFFLSLIPINHVGIFLDTFAVLNPHRKAPPEPVLELAELDALELDQQALAHRSGVLLRVGDVGDGFLFAGDR